MFPTQGTVGLSAADAIRMPTLARSETFQLIDTDMTTVELR